MALANYTDLLASIAGWLNRTDLTAVIPDFVTLAEARIARDLRLRRQVTLASVIVSDENVTAALPTGFLEIENASVASDFAVDYTTIAPAILQYVVGLDPGLSLFGASFNGRKLGDIDNNGVVEVADATAMTQYTSGTASAGVIAYVEGTMTDNIVANAYDYAAYLTTPTSHTNTSQLHVVTPEYIGEKYPPGSTSGRPDIYTIVGDEILLGPEPDGPYYIALDYYKRWDALTVSASNWLLTNYPMVYLSAALMEGWMYLQDSDKVALWDARYRAEVKTLQDADDAALRSGSQMRVRAM